jgi:hypothetical protein
MVGIEPEWIKKLSYMYIFIVIQNVGVEDWRIKFEKSFIFLFLYMCKKSLYGQWNLWILMVNINDDYIIWYFIANIMLSLNYCI